MALSELEGIVLGLSVAGFLFLSCSLGLCLRFILRSRRRPASPQEFQPASTGRKSKIKKRDSLKRHMEETFIAGLAEKQAEESGNPAWKIKKGLRKAGRCSICLERYKGDPHEIFLGFLKKCGHYYHFECIWAWLERKRSCPFCREKVRLKEEDIQGLSLHSFLAGDVTVNAGGKDMTCIMMGEDNISFMSSLSSRMTFREALSRRSSRANLLDHVDADDQSHHSEITNDPAHLTSQVQRNHVDDDDQSHLSEISSGPTQLPGEAQQNTESFSELQCHVCKNNFSEATEVVIVGFGPCCRHFYHYGCMSSSVTDERCCELFSGECDFYVLYKNGHRPELGHEENMRAPEDPNQLYGVQVS